jgi:hypothetical protein
MGMDAQRMPGDAEADAACRVMQDLYGRHLRLGDLVWWRLDEWPAGRTASSVVCGRRDGRLIVDYAGELVEIEPDQIMPF